MRIYDEKIVDLMDSTPHQVDLILRVPEAQFKNPPSLKQLTSLKYQQHPRLGYVIFVGKKANPVVRFLITTITSIRGLKMHMFETLDEAMMFLQRTRNHSV
jgi:hypothetical protein